MSELMLKPAQALEVAGILQKFVNEKKLTANIQGKQYPLVEAWQFAASQLGLVPVVVELVDLSNESEIKYRSTVELIQIEEGKVLSRGIAVCSNKEYSKKRFDEYAIASMAQTRAVGKACRNILAWMMKAAGFEATPAEEMDFVKDEVGPDSRDFLLALLESSTYEGKMKDKLASRIGDIITQNEYDTAKQDLLNNQIGIEGAINPSAKEINAHVKKIAK